MGLLDGFLSGMGGGATNSFGIPKTGISALDNLVKDMDEKAKQPQPGKFCTQGCQLVGSERCPACLERQKALEQSLYELQKLDEAIQSPKPQAPAKPRPVKCSLCGAPVEDGLRECPYCGTAYPAFDGGGSVELPDSDYDRDLLYLTRATETYRLYAEMYLENMEYSKQRMQSKLPKLVQGLTGALADQLASACAPMTPQQIRQGAQQYGVSYYGYVFGAITGAYESRQTAQVQEQMQARARRLDELNERLERNRQIEQERQAKLRKINQERAAIMYNSATRVTPQYNGGGGSSSGGGSSHCCGSCQYYRAYDKACLENHFRHPSGPNDYCGSYRSL